MKKIIIWILAGLLVMNFSFAKDMFEYGGTTLFLENQQYQDGYRFDHNATGKNTYYTQRTYLTGYYNYDDQNRVRLTLDSSGYHAVKNQNNLDSAAIDNHVDNWVFVKYLYWESGSFSNWFDKLYVGQIETPWIGYEEKIWGKRFMAKSLLDLYGVTNSADRGIGIKSKVLGGSGEYYVVIDTGNGYKVQSVSNRYNLEGRYTHNLSDKLSVSVGGGTGWLALKGLTTMPSSLQDWAEVARVDYEVGNIAYKDKGNIILTATVYNKIVDNDGPRQGTITHSSGSSIAAVKTLLPKLDLIARLDNIDPDASVAGDKTQKSIIGASYDINDNISVAYSMQADSNEYKNFSTAPTHINYLQTQILF